ncbi:Plasmodium vivax Vir protein, putative [Plasmodium vivax]|uniref:Vir protein, putative n=1 Tax=Plasmodium vivax TaxID=5855 RepID=A0A1G4E3J6_PLAVI|nr:Plasmodium vivax Vir protein, putative [Plasmodium vivax]
MLVGNEESWKEFQRSALSFSGDLNSEKFYNGLEDLNGYRKYFENCESLTSLPNGKVVRNYCARLLKYLETNKFSRNNDNEYDYCLLLNYWLFSSLNVILHSSNSSYAYHAFGRIGNIWNTFIKDTLKRPESEICQPNFDIIVHNDWRDRKELYEYYVNYYPVRQTIDHYPEKCKEFYEYIESKKAVYEHFKEPCPNSDTNKCPDFYKQCEQYNPEDVLPTLSCHTKIMQERAADTSRVPQLRKDLLGSETDSEETNGPMRPFDGPKLSGNPKAVENVGNIFLGVVATTMTSGALYRFTPLGNMIRNGLGWNNNNMRNFNGGDIGLYDYASESFNPYPGEEHYIGYHPA